jgi:hypothetical protein
MAKVTIVEGHESWTAMYINGRREYQDHRISTRQLLRFSQEHDFEMKDVTFLELSEAQSESLEKTAYVGRTFIGYPEKIWDIPEYAQSIQSVARSIAQSLVPAGTAVLTGVAPREERPAAADDRSFWVPPTEISPEETITTEGTT